MSKESDELRLIAQQLREHGERFKGPRQEILAERGYLLHEAIKRGAFGGAEFLPMKAQMAHADETWFYFRLCSSWLAERDGEQLHPNEAERGCKIVAAAIDHEADQLETEPHAPVDPPIQCSDDCGWWKIRGREFNLPPSARETMSMLLDVAANNTGGLRTSAISAELGSNASRFRLEHYFKGQSRQLFNELVEKMPSDRVRLKPNLAIKRGDRMVTRVTSP